MSIWAFEQWAQLRHRRFQMKKKKTIDELMQRHTEHFCNVSRWYTTIGWFQKKKTEHNDLAVPHLLIRWFWPKWKENERRENKSMDFPAMALLAFQCCFVEIFIKRRTLRFIWCAHYIECGLWIVDASQCMLAWLVAGCEFFGECSFAKRISIFIMWTHLFFHVLIDG